MKSPARASLPIESMGRPGSRTRDPSDLFSGPDTISCSRSFHIGRSPTGFVAMSWVACTLTSIAFWMEEGKIPMPIIRIPKTDATTISPSLRSPSALAVGSFGAP